MPRCHYVLHLKLTHTLHHKQFAKGSGKRQLQYVTMILRVWVSAGGGAPDN